MEHEPSTPARVAPAAAAADAVSPPASGAPRRVWIGLALLLAAALIFSLHNAIARLAYDEGVTPTTITAMRTWAIMIMFAILFGPRGQWPAVPRAAWAVFAVTALFYAIHNPLLLFAFQFIPVSLAVLVLYLYPLLVAFMAASIGQERVKGYTIAAAAVAFVGVALVLEIGRVALDWRGLVLAAISAVALAANIVGAVQLNRHMRPLAVPFALSCVGVVVFSTMMFADGGPHLPKSGEGWWLFAAAIMTSPLALVAFYIALPLTGAPRSALVLNVEPILTVLIAMALLGETLDWIQAAGAALIIGALAVAAVMDLKSRRL